MASEQEWREAYDLKAADLARETERLSRLIKAVEAEGHRSDGRFRAATCGLCQTLREVTGQQAAPANGSNPSAVPDA